MRRMKNFNKRQTSWRPNEMSSFCNLTECTDIHIKWIIEWYDCGSLCGSSDRLESAGRIPLSKRHSIRWQSMTIWNSGLSKWQLRTFCGMTTRVSHPLPLQKWRKIHAVLCVDVDDYTSTKRAIFDILQCVSTFSTLSKSRILYAWLYHRRNDSFSIHLALTFGRHWTFEATQGGPIQPVLPTLVITDSRYPTTTRRFYLDAPDLLLSSTSSIHDFHGPILEPSIDALYEILLQWTRSNQWEWSPGTHGCHLLRCSHESKWKAYTPLLVYSDMWSLQTIFDHLEWTFSITTENWAGDSLFQIAKMDVTTNEIHDLDLDTREVPQVYFIPKTNKNSHSLWRGGWIWRWTWSIEWFLGYCRMVARCHCRRRRLAWSRRNCCILLTRRRKEWSCPKQTAVKMIQKQTIPKKTSKFERKQTVE